jgi:uncharacterized membrane protein YeaQ/YmgE (transglycosylase-associated protein family)
MDLVVTILVGLAVGVMVELLLPGHTFGELVLAMFLGIAGALLTRLVGTWAGFFEGDEPSAFVAAIVGAIVVLLLYGVVFRRHWKRRGH